MPEIPYGDLNISINCCPDIPGTTPPSVAPYVVSIGGRQGIVGLEATGAFSIGYNAATNSIILGVAAGSGLGTVTSVGLSSSSTGLVVTGATPITTFGDFALSLDATLQALSQVVTAADLLIYATGVDTFATTSLTAYARTLLDDASAATARGTLGGTTIGQALFTLTNPSQVGFIRTDVANTVTARTAAETRTDLSLVIGTNVQAWSADLDSFVTFASWTVSDLTLVGGLTVADLVAKTFTTTEEVATGINLLLLKSDVRELFKVVDNGAVVVTPNFTGATSCFTVTNSAAGVAMDLSANGNVSFLGTVSGAQFDGDGAALTNLSASELNSGTVPSARIAGAYTGITQVGTLTAGALGSGFSVVAGAQGGTGVANSGKTITLGGNVTTSGAFNVTFTLTAGTNVTLPTSGTLYGTASGSITSAQLATSVTDETGSGSLVFGTSPSLTGAALTSPTFDKTVTAAGTTGNRTINKVAGTVNFAAAATTLTVTNSLVSATSQVFCFIQTDDSTAVLKNVVCSSGQFVIKMATAPTAETAVAFLVLI